MYEFIYFQVRDVMTPDPITVDDQVSLAAVEAIFEKYDFNGLPVVGEKHQLVGMITKLDLLKAFDFKGKSKISLYETIMAQKVLRVMTKEIHFVYPETPLTRVLQNMIETGRESFPVVEKDHVVGIIAREDVILALRLAAVSQLPTRLTASSMEGLFEGSNT